MDMCFKGSWFCFDSRTLTGHWTFGLLPSCFDILESKMQSVIMPSDAYETNAIQTWYVRSFGHPCNSGTKGDEQLFRMGLERSPRVPL